MNPQRRRIGVKKARRVLDVWRACSASDRFDPFYASGGPMEQVMTHTRVKCSCPMCGNPRRHYGELTPQEHRADEAMSAQLAEVGL